MDIGPGELVILGLVLLLVFGGSKIPTLARTLGQAKSEFEKGMRGEDDESQQPAAAATAQSELPPPNPNPS